MGAPPSVGSCAVDRHMKAVHLPTELWCAVVSVLSFKDWVRSCRLVSKEAAQWSWYEQFGGEYLRVVDSAQALAAALQVANGSGVILLRPGMYQVNLALFGSVRLLGLGHGRRLPCLAPLDVDAPTVSFGEDSDDPALSCAALTRCRPTISNLIVRGARHKPAIRVLRCCPVITQCDVADSGSFGVFLSHRCAGLKAQRCKIHDNDYGIGGADGKGGTQQHVKGVELVQCQIYRNRVAGVHFSGMNGPQHGSGVHLLVLACDLNDNGSSLDNGADVVPCEAGTQVGAAQAQERPERRRRRTRRRGGCRHES